MRRFKQLQARIDIEEPDAEVRALGERFGRQKHQLSIMKEKNERMKLRLQKLCMFCVTLFMLIVAMCCVTCVTMYTR